MPDNIHFISGIPEPDHELSMNCQKVSDEIYKPPAWGLTKTIMSTAMTEHTTVHAIHETHCNQVW